MEVVSTDPVFAKAAADWQDFYLTHPPFFAERCPDGLWRIFGWNAPDENAAVSIFTTRLPRNEREARKISAEMCREHGREAVVAKIIHHGFTREPPNPWYLEKQFICPTCNAHFELERRDFDGEEVGANFDEPTWEIVATARTPGGVQIIEGECPDCHQRIRFEGRNNA